MLKKILFCAVLAVVFSCEETLFEPDISEDTINLLAPVDGVTVRSETTQFSWSGIDGATSYRIQVAQPSFENASQILVDTVVEQLSYSERLFSGEYQWRVRGENSGHQTPFTTATFIVQ